MKLLNWILSLLGALILLFTTTQAATSNIYVCPTNGTNHIEIPVGTTVGGSTNVTIAMSPTCTLCMLVRMSSLIGNLSSLSMQDWNMVPVARSYLHNDWENVAGPYVDKLKINCGSSSCTLTIPHLANVPSPAHYALLATNRQVSTKEQVARFLEQVTFGTTLEDVNKFNLSSSLNVQYATWVRQQMDSSITAPTYHREYFRARADNFMAGASATFTTRPRHPCQANSRWRKYSFFQVDYSDNPTINVQMFNATSYLISIHGIPRTLTNKFQGYSDGLLVDLPEGNYYFSYFTEEYVGGRVVIGNGVGLWSLAGGNPPLFLPQSVISQYNPTIKTLQLPDRQFFQDIDPTAYEPKYAPPYRQFYLGAGIMSTVNITDSQCPRLTSSLNLIGVFPNDDQWYYDARIILDENTIENPLSDGGGMTGTFCSNVAKNFLNLDKCTLSTAQSACMPFSTPSVPIILNEASLRLLYEGTGRYVYIIRQLQTAAAYVKSPCTPMIRHRWMIINSASCPTTAGISTETINALTAIMNDMGSNRNSVFTDINLEWSSYSGSYGGYTCDASNTKTVGMMFAVTNNTVTCFKHVHPDEGSVYDFSYWTRPDTHPGNAIAAGGGRQNPITKWADINNNFTLPFPGFHTMNLWENNRGYFDYVGRAYNTINFMDLPSMLRTQAVARLFSPPLSNISQAVVVCGSYGEVANTLANNVSTTNIFSFANNGSPKGYEELRRQKSNVWNMISLSSQDQLRQRMAWALSQILIVTPKQINEEWLSEAFLNYYDIFVRNAFGSYRDILKEVSQSPMMAEMLSFLESKSSAYVLRSSKLTARPDENFAREVMQLFSIGVYLLNIDGTLKVSPSTGLPIPTYRNTDIQTFARAWTGFLRQSARGNVEIGDWSPNRIDPMAINPTWRDVFPKMDLFGGYIGDSYPLCSDLPKRQFLNIGAKYILLGSSAIPEYQNGDEYWKEGWWRAYQNITNLSLNTTSSALHSALCNAGSDGKCRFQLVVVLNETLTCEGNECLIDEPRTIRVYDNPLIYYEYIRPACVELTFYSNGRIAREENSYEGYPGICANPAVDKAFEACCESGNTGGYMFCQFTGEKVLYNTAVSRCSANARFSNGGLCTWTWISDYYSNPNCAVWTPPYKNWHWTDQNCTVQAKVDDLGRIAVVHVSWIAILQDYDLASNNFFPVTWQASSFPSPSNNCGNNVCTLHSGSCLCNVAVVDSAVFSARPSVSDITSSLFIGSVPPSWFGTNYSLTESANGVDVYQQSGASPYSMNTIFGVTVNAQAKFFKNMRSMITIGSGSKIFSARNPPHFMSFLVQDTRDAMYETDAVIDHYFYHPNVAPFISKRIIQRFGISNPSPRYIAQAATAFTTGTYTSQGVSFGDGKYGNLGALVAAIVLDREARSSVLDSDPTFGSLREPMIKLMAFLRAMMYKSRMDVKELSFVGLSNSIGQMPHDSPNVFSFFLPDYTPSGAIKDASLVAPEAQVQTTPNLVGFVNGIISLVEVGLTQCYGGFGQQNYWSPCPCHENQGSSCYTPPSNYSSGLLTYSPASFDTESIVDELSLLLTSGRLSSSYRKTLADVIGNAVDISTGIKTAQKLIAASSAFHTTSLVQTQLEDKPDVAAPVPSTKPYKAVVFVNLSGGIDSYNVLMPKSQCRGTGGKDLYLDYKTVRGELAMDNSTTLPINSGSTTQPCKIFGIHPSMTVVQKLYNDRSLVFLANVGVLQEYVNTTNWEQKTTKTQLFAHNIQGDEISYVDMFREAAGFGVCGRMADMSRNAGFKAGSISVSGVAKAMVSKLTPLLVVSPNGIDKVNPIPWASDIVGPIKRLNKVERVGSNIYGETWSDMLLQALGENQLLYNAFTQTTLGTNFNRANHLSLQFEAVSKLIKSRNARGVDRDMFYVETLGFDTHADMISGLADRVNEINDALGSFVNEMKAQGRWNDTVLVFVSEFARTLIPNTSSGSDHAWGGNYWVAGGSVNGGKVLGKFISDYTEKSPLIFNPGIVIPTTSWEQVWETIAKWYGITKESDLDYVIPSRKKFAGPLAGMFA